MSAGWLEHPLARGRDIDAPETTHLRKEIIRRKQFLRRIYDDWYQWMESALPPAPGGVLEIGSGAGYLHERIPGLIRSDIIEVPGLTVVLDAEQLPLASGTLRAIVMTNVLHHIPRVRCFLTEAARCVRRGGVALMLEPWNTHWSAFVYRHLHHEPFAPDAADWEFPASGPLSGANGALPWILFQRDRSRFEAEFPAWNLEYLRPQMPFRYLLSGGVTYRSFLPGFSYGLVRSFERVLDPWRRHLGMFACICLRRM